MKTPVFLIVVGVVVMVVVTLGHVWRDVEEMRARVATLEANAEAGAAQTDWLLRHLIPAQKIKPLTNGERRVLIWTTNGPDVRVLTIPGGPLQATTEGGN